MLVYLIPHVTNCEPGHEFEAVCGHGRRECLPQAARAARNEVAAECVKFDKRTKLLEKVDLRGEWRTADKGQ